MCYGQRAYLLRHIWRELFPELGCEEDKSRDHADHRHCRPSDHVINLELGAPHFVCEKPHSSPIAPYVVCCSRCDSARAYALKRPSLFSLNILSSSKFLLYDVALPSGGSETRDLLPLSFWLHLNSPRQCASLPYPAANGVNCCRVPVIPGLVYNTWSPL